MRSLTPTAKAALAALRAVGTATVVTGKTNLELNDRTAFGLEERGLAKLTLDSAGDVVSVEPVEQS